MFTGPNGNRIFMPATLWYNYSHEETNYGGEQDYGGYYWSSSLVMTEANAALVFPFHSIRCEDCFNNGTFRRFGLFVRAVCQQEYASLDLQITAVGTVRLLFL